jgi:hypothetical protein
VARIVHEDATGGDREGVTSRRGILRQHARGQRGYRIEEISEAASPFLDCINPEIEPPE